MSHRENPESPETVDDVIDCEAAAFTAAGCATCQGTGKVGPYSNSEGRPEMRACRPCSIPVGTGTPMEGWRGGGWV